MRSPFALIAGLAVTINGVLGAQNQLQRVTNFGTNPNNVGMYVYRPTRLANPLPLIVAIHYCTGSAQAYFSGTQYANLADTYGYMVVYPDSPRDGKCFDVASSATLTHNGGGDSLGIASMIRYAIQTYGVDPNRVFVTGTSSGAMMTNVMAGAYPELFQAASSYAGVPFGCFAGSGAWNSQCANGQLIKTGQQWGDQVRAAYPGYSGRRPKIALWHGTADTTLNYQNFREAIKQWTNVFGVSESPSSTTNNDPVSGYTKTTYGSNLVAYSGAGVSHSIPTREQIDLQWFGIIGGSNPPSTSSARTSSVRTSSSARTSSTPSGSGTGSPLWGQCGGLYWNGPRTCAQGTCRYSNDWYSQCVP